jgi:hypothetical protein
MTHLFLEIANVVRFEAEFSYLAASIGLPSHFLLASPNSITPTFLLPLVSCLAALEFVLFDLELLHDAVE